MTDAELWLVIWKALRMVESALEMVDQAIAKRHGFGKFNPLSTQYNSEPVPPETMVK